MTTAKDVAAYAGVSTATVARVVGGYGYVSEETRRRVLEAVRALNYHPNAIARSMVKGSTNTIGLVVSDTANPFYPDVIRGVEDVCHRAGYNVILCNSDEDVEKEQRYLRVLMAKQIDGLIMTTTSDGVSYLLDITQRKIPVVMLDRAPKGSGFDSVTVDNRGGAYEAVQHLIKLGHRRIGVITAPTRIWTSNERLEGYKMALKEHGIPIQSELIYQDDRKEEGGYRGAMRLMGIDNPPTALFTTNNLRTVGALRYLKERGVNIPKQLSIIGFDDQSWMGLLDPPLTVVAQPAYFLGTSAGELLVQRLQGKAPMEEQVVVMKASLVVRKSCAPPSGHS